MNWKRWLIALATRKKYKQFINDTLNPKAAQARLWKKEILPLLKQSEYWQPVLEGHHIEDLDEFEITAFEDYEHTLLAAHNSRIQPLNGEELIFWSETAGTTGTRKMFPITSSFQQQFQRTMAPFIYNLTQIRPGFLKEKILYLVAVSTNTSTPAGIPCGWISNFNYRHLPSLVKSCYALPDEVFDHAQWFQQWAPAYALASDLSAIFAVTPMMIEDFYEACASQLKYYLPYLSGEQLMPAFLPPLKIKKRRLAYLRKLSCKANFSVKELWPSLTVGGCWISGLCAHIAEELQKKMGSQVHLIDGTYSATEGWVTVPLECDKEGGVLHPGAHIFEFIEEGKDRDEANLLSCWQLETGKKYELFLTTAMGFVRYRLKDIVCCTGFFNKAPKLVFCYKAQLLKLESCAITNEELQTMLQGVNFYMEPHWYFARNRLGNKLVLVVDDTVSISEDLLTQMHEQLIQISSIYANGAQTGYLLPVTLFQLPKQDLLAGRHAQTKPNLISHQVILER